MWGRLAARRPVGARPLAPDQPIHGAAQNEYFSANWICRLSAAVPVTRPKVPVPSEPPGLLNCGVLDALNSSARNRSWWLSRYGILNDFEATRSNVCRPGPTTGSRGDVP